MFPIVQRTTWIKINNYQSENDNSTLITFNDFFNCYLFIYFYFLKATALVCSKIHYDKHYFRFSLIVESIFMMGTRKYFVCT